MRLQKTFAVWLLVWFLLSSFSGASAKEREAYFSLSSDRTYLPGEKAKIRVYAHGVNTLEFRVYRVSDPAAFFEKLDDVHSFGHIAPREQVEEKTWIERFHDWKSSRWYRVRNFFRSQYSAESRAKIREAQAQLGLGAIPARDSMLPLRYQVLAVEALQRELITEGRFARMLGVDRLEARQIFETLRQSGGTSTQGGSVEIDLAQTLDLPSQQ